MLSMVVAVLFPLEAIDFPVTTMSPSVSLVCNVLLPIVTLSVAAISMLLPSSFD